MISLAHSPFPSKVDRSRRLLHDNARMTPVAAPFELALSYSHALDVKSVWKQDPSNARRGEVVNNEA